MKLFYFILLALNSISVLCQDGQLDPTFNPTINTDTYINAITTQDDNKILLGGGFNSIIRLNEDGSTDTSFDASNSVNGIARFIVVQNDQKIIISGGSSYYINRLNEDGSLDTSFNFSGENSISVINKVVVLDNGKIMIAGRFDKINNNLIEAVARLNSDGSLDSTFNLNLPPITSLRDMVIQPDGKIIIIGQNDESNQFKIFRRYLTDGTLDPTFNGDEEHYIYGVELQQDGKIMICGTFQEYNGITQYNVARLNNDGTLDTTFVSYNLPQNGSNYTIFDVSICNDGKYIINGGFSIYNDTPSNQIAKINSNGTIDNSFNIGTGPNNSVWETYIQEDEKILIGGIFTTYNGTSTNLIARLNNSILSINTNLIKGNFSFYPNPTQDVLFIESQEPIEIVKIYSLQGQLIIEGSSNRVDVSQLTTGLYFVQVSSNDKTSTKRFIKE